MNLLATMYVENLIRIRVLRYADKIVLIINFTRRPTTAQLITLQTAYRNLLESTTKPIIVDIEKSVPSQFIDDIPVDWHIDFEGKYHKVLRSPTTSLLPSTLLHL